MEPLISIDYLGPELYPDLFQHVILADTRNIEDIIICRSRAIKYGDPVKLFCYHLVEDRWSAFRLPPHCALEGLESMIHHSGAIYFLVSKREDMYGYMHNTPETKHFWRCILGTGKWEELKTPNHVVGSCRLVSHVNGVYVIDRSGRVEEYDVDQSVWTLTCDAVFDCSTPTLYVVPMPMDR